ncbi:MAG: VanZ family protein [Haloglomus sp.]
MSGDRRAATVARWGRLLAPVVVAAFVLVASVTEPSGGPPTPPVFGLPADKVLHGIAYAALAAALGLGLATPGGGELRRRRPLRQVALLAVASAVAYGLAVECLQFLIPYRAFDLQDAAANAAGAIAGAALWAGGATLRRRLGG